MKKELFYLIELLAKNEEKSLAEPYKTMLDSFSLLEIYTPTKYTQKQIRHIMSSCALPLPSSHEDAIARIDEKLANMLPEVIEHNKKQIFLTLLLANFPKKKKFLDHSLQLFISQLEPVEKQIYDNIVAYVITLNRVLSIFYIIGANSTPEDFLIFANTLHVKLLYLIFNDEERVHIENALKTLLGVYLSLYGKFLYM